MFELPDEEGTEKTECAVFGRKDYLPVQEEDVEEEVPTIQNVPVKTRPARRSTTTANNGAFPAAEDTPHDAWDDELDDAPDEEEEEEDNE